MKEWIFAFTAASILMSGGQGRLKPSPGNFFVASMPSLLPLAISLVAWSSTSDGPLVSPRGRPPCCRAAGQCWRRGGPDDSGRRRSNRGDEVLIVIPNSSFVIPAGPAWGRLSADTHEDEVVEDAFGRPAARCPRSQGSSSCTLTPSSLFHRMGEGGRRLGEGRAANVEVFHRRHTDDGAGIISIRPRCVFPFATGW